MSTSKLTNKTNSYPNFAKMFYVFIATALSIFLFILFTTIASAIFPLFIVIIAVLSLSMLVHIINKNENPSFKIAWIILILIIPIWGSLIYLIYGMHHIPKKKRDMIASFKKTILELHKDDNNNLIEKLRNDDPYIAMQSDYILKNTGVPLSEHTETEFFDCGEKFFESMLKELKKAKKYICLEYFAIKDGYMWSSILDILNEKKKEGVEIRVLYDDIGSFCGLPHDYADTLRKNGIRARVFNPLKTFFGSNFNYRDHRKICAIDGTVAFTGGVNIADEYINRIERFGYWKDTAVMLKGEGAWFLTVEFFALWHTIDKADAVDIKSLAPSKEELTASYTNGYTHIYTDMPGSQERLAENVYFNMINRAKRTLYITTPYLIINNEIMTALNNSARCGVDVRIIVPGIPDKKVANQLTKSFYRPLLEAGVKIYEYTPGFIHSKTIVVDGEVGVVGSINFDYRSMYIQLESAAWMYKTTAIDQLSKDYSKTIEESREITLESLPNEGMFKKLWLAVLRTISPLF